MSNVISANITSTFYDRWANAEEFLDMFEASPFTIEATEQEINEIYYQLLTEYMQSNFAVRTELQQDLQIMKLINNHYPELRKKLEIQKNILNMSIEDLSKGTSYVKSGLSAPDVDSDVLSGDNKDMPFINSKNLSIQISSDIQTIQKQYNLLYSGLWNEFVERFRKVFVMLIVGTNTLFTMDNEDWNN